MQKLSCLIIVIYLFSGCNSSDKVGDSEKVSVNDTRKTIKADRFSKKKIDWTDSLLKVYLSQTGNELIKSSRQKNIELEWIYDRTENTDTAKYLVFQIGHSFEHKLITDGWVYVDSVTRYIYEYDVADDKLTRWAR